ncbi:MAG: acetyltransferase, partial [Spirochaetaceae bacterium]
MNMSILLDGGYSMPGGTTIGQRVSLVIGRLQVKRHGRSISLGRETRISSDARIHPRQGRMTIGDDCVISPGAIVQGNVRLGRHCSIQAYSIVVGYGDADQDDGVITFGDYVRVAPHVSMFATNHRFDDPSRPIHGQGHQFAPIRIGDDVWIAAGVRIMAGVTIGSGSVIAAGAVVTKDIPEFSIAGGVPARVIRRRG